MTTGLATIRRGIGFGGLSTLSRGSLGGVVVALQLLVICPPTISFALLNPELGVADVNPSIAMTALSPMAESKDINPLISTELLGPDVDSGGCC